MIEVKIKIAVKRATRDRKRDIVSALMLVGEALRSELAQYPGPVKRPIRWKSLEQRRAFFAKMRKLGETPPYRRTISRGSERLGKSYVVAPTSRGVVVRSRASYSAYVQSARYQQPFHKATGWRTDRDAIRKIENNRRLWRKVAELIA